MNPTVSNIIENPTEVIEGRKPSSNNSDTESDADSYKEDDEEVYQEFLKTVVEGDEAKGAEDCTAKPQEVPTETPPQASEEKKALDTG